MVGAKKMEIPGPINQTSDLIDKYHESKKQERRGHFGISMIGKPCDRYKWLSFRWVITEKYPGRIMRLFRRGNLEEQTVIDDLQNVGIDVREFGANQRNVKISGHVKGSIDGIIHGGVPEAPRAQHILEIKTHSKKSFELLKKEGVQKSKPEHFAQMQGYMLATGIERALYFAVCKDNDEIYTERVKLDREYAKKITEKAVFLSLSEEMPAPLSNDPGWYQCKTCQAHDFCHVSKKTTEANCRTCAHSTPLESGAWRCEKWQAEIPETAQKSGCHLHVIRPDIVPWELVDAETTADIAAYKIGDKIYKNGPGHITSAEMVKPGFSEGIMLAREIFAGEVVG